MEYKVSGESGAKGKYDAAEGTKEDWQFQILRDSLLLYRDSLGTEGFVRGPVQSC